MRYEVISSSSKRSMPPIISASSLVSLASPPSAFRTSSPPSASPSRNDHDRCCSCDCEPCCLSKGAAADVHAEQTFLLSRTHELEVALNELEDRHAQRQIEHLQDNQTIALRIYQMEKVLFRHSKELVCVIEQMKEQMESYEEIMFRQKSDALLIQR